MSFRTTWHVDNETPALTVTTSRYSYRMLCWFFPVPPSRQSTTISCQTLSSSSLTSADWLMNRQGSERKRSQPDDAPLGDHEALNKNSWWPGLERGPSSLERYLSEHIWIVPMSVHICTKTPPLCSSLNNLQYSAPLNTALCHLSPLPLRPLLGPS